MARENGSTFLLLGAAAVAFYGYTQGWFSSLFGTTAAAATSTAAQQAAAAAAAAAKGPVVPPVGTVLTNAADLAAQVAAKDPYILPGPALIGQAPAGYSLAMDSMVGEVGGTGSAQGGFYVRNDVASALVALMNALQTATNVATGGVSAPVTLETLYQYPIQNLAQLKTVMSSAGLTGLGDYQRHMYTRTGRYRPARVA